MFPVIWSLGELFFLTVRNIAKLVLRLISTLFPYFIKMYIYVLYVTS